MHTVTETFYAKPKIVSNTYITVNKLLKKKLTLFLLVFCEH